MGYASDRAHELRVVIEDTVEISRWSPCAWAPLTCAHDPSVRASVADRVQQLTRASEARGEPLFPGRGRTTTRWTLEPRRPGEPPRVRFVVDLVSFARDDEHADHPWPYPARTELRFADPAADTLDERLPRYGEPNGRTRVTLVFGQLGKKDLWPDDAGFWSADEATRLLVAEGFARSGDVLRRGSTEVLVVRPTEARLRSRGATEAVRRALAESDVVYVNGHARSGLFDGLTAGTEREPRPKLVFVDTCWSYALETTALRAAYPHATLVVTDGRVVTGSAAVVPALVDAATTRPRKRTWLTHINEAAARRAELRRDHRSLEPTLHAPEVYGLIAPEVDLDVSCIYVRSVSRERRFCPTRPRARHVVRLDRRVLAVPSRAFGRSIMADITSVLFVRHVRGEPTSHVLFFRDGQLRRSGRGLSFWFAPLGASLAEIPLDDRELPFLFHGTSADFQEITVQGILLYRVVAPEILAQRVDFTLDTRTGAHAKQPLDKLATALTQRAQELAMTDLARSSLRALLADGAPRLRDAIHEGLVADEGFSLMGLEIVATRVASVKPTAEMERALQMPTRETIQQQADEATFARRALAVEKERAIAENELQSKIELARQEERYIDQQGANERRRATEQAEAERIAAAAAVARKRELALAESESIRVIQEATVAAERDRMAIYRDLPPATMMGLAARELAVHLPSIQHLSLSPDALGPLVQRWMSASAGELEAAGER